MFLEDDNGLQEAIKYYKNKFPYVVENDVYDILNLVTIKQYKIGDYVVRLEENNANVFFVAKGLLKTYYLDEKENQVIMNFYPETSLSGNWHATLLREPSQLCIQAIEPTVLFLVKLEAIDELSLKNRNIMRGYNEVLKEKLTASLQRIWNSINEKPETRYREFVSRQPGLVTRISQKDLAAYIGVTPVSLSRMKKRIRVEEEKKAPFF